MESGQDGPIATLLLLNGPPAVGKTTLAERWVAANPEGRRCIDVDRLRTLLDGWQHDETTKLTARDLALSAIDESLSDGLDVVVPQFLGRLSFLEELSSAASKAGARFVEVVLWDEEATVVERFTARRAELVARGTPHPQDEVVDIEAAIADASMLLRSVVAARPGSIELSLSTGADAVLTALDRCAG